MPYMDFSNNFGKKIRLWFDDLPSATLLSNEATRENRVLSGGLVDIAWKRVAVEIFQPFGASFHYGLLGGEYQSTGESNLEVIVPIDTPFPERRYDDALTGSLDAVMIGGLPEYANAIYTALDKLGIEARPSGLLNITCMAHGEVGSAPIVFDGLARALIRALCSAGQPTSLEEAMALLVA